MHHRMAHLVAVSKQHGALTVFVASLMHELEWTAGLWLMVMLGKLVV